MSYFDKLDLLSEKYVNEKMLTVAQDLLSEEDQTEEAFLGAQGVLLLAGLI